MKLKILIVEDHPSMIEGYKIILSYNTKDYEIEATSAFNCKTAYDIITDTTEFDVILLDYSLPAYPEKGINSGKDLAVLTRKQKPDSKIIVLTSHSEALILYDLIVTVEPEGILVKSDFSAEELLKAFELIVEGGTYHSTTVTQNVSELLSKKIYLDSYNRKIISLLAEGIKTKNIPNYMNLSISAVEKRKVQIKDYLGIDKGGDEEIIRKAKEAGLI
jgi:two-component system, NarL family, response regulator NreC